MRLEETERSIKKENPDKELQNSISTINIAILRVWLKLANVRLKYATEVFCNLEKCPLGVDFHI